MVETTIGAWLPVPEQQPDEVISQANPISGTIYPVLALTRNVRIIGINCSVTWTVQPTPLEVHAQIDGITYRWRQNNPATATPYYAITSLVNAENLQLLSGTNRDEAFLLECRTIEISIETTGGTVQSLDCRVKWARW